MQTMWLMDQQHQGVYFEENSENVLIGCNLLTKHISFQKKLTKHIQSWCYTQTETLWYDNIVKTNLQTVPLKFNIIWFYFLKFQNFDYLSYC